MDEVHSLSLYIIKVPVGSFRFHESLTAINKDLRLADLFMHDTTNNKSNNIGITYIQVFFCFVNGNRVNPMTDPYFRLSVSIKETKNNFCLHV